MITMPKLILTLAMLLTTLTGACGMTVQVIYTGGTIGMVYDSNGQLIPGPPNAFSGEIFRVAEAAITPEQRDKTPLDVSVVELSPLLDSCNIGLHEWKMMTQAIGNSNADGFVIVHGTDTMAYTSSALSFMLYNFAKPVVITGSQIPLCNPNSDGVSNLAGSFQAIRMMFMREISGVAVYFAGLLMQGVTVTKNSAVLLEAFDNPGAHPHALIAHNVPMVRSRYNFDPAAKYVRPIFRNVENDIPFHVKELDNHVGTFLLFREGHASFTHHLLAVFVLTPDLSTEILEANLRHSKGLLLMTYGANNVPSNRLDMIELLARYVKKGKLIVSLSQVYHKANTQSAYETGNVMKKIGVVDGNAMTLEAAVIKMRWILASKLDPEQRRQAMQCNFLGEYPGSSSVRECTILWDLVGRQ